MRFLKLYLLIKTFLISFFVVLCTGRETDSYGVFTIDPLTGIVRTKSVLDHEERSVYRIAVAAADNGVPPKQTVRVLRIEVLGINDNRPTFSSSSLFFKVSCHINTLCIQVLARKCWVIYTVGIYYGSYLLKLRNALPSTNIN